MRLSIYFILILHCLLAANSAKADTLFVYAHRNVDLVQHTNYDRQAYFNTEGKTFRKVYMLYTLGCASGGCSDWDYDVNNFLMHNTGLKDSSVASLDKISANPLVVDTTWNVFDKIERFELGRFITPYGTYMNFRNGQYGVAGYDSSWKHTFIYDVTDYQMLMEDTVTIRSQYNGWSSGFSATIQFVMIEGTPQRSVLGISNVYDRGGGYQNTQQFETNVIPERTFEIPNGTAQAQVKVIITGHGANAAEGCGEFCDKNYEYKVDGISRFTQRMWRDDCGRVAVAPQGGTWIFSRGNWCPGDKVREHRHEITPYLDGNTVKLDMDIQPYVLSGTGGSSHNISSTVFFYGSDNYKVDAELHTIISPSTFSEHIPYNPSCGQTIVVIKNNAHTPLTYTKIEYGPKGGQMLIQEWTGNLGFEEKDTVYLGTPVWTGIDQTQNRFVARIYNQNHLYADDLEDNDVYETAVELVPRLDPFRLLFRTNGVPEENKLTITNHHGEVVFELDDLSANTLYQEELNLPNGCYELLLTDEGGDGLDFWYWSRVNPPYTAGRSGYIRIFKQGGGVYENFGGDFGSELRYSFIIGEMNFPTAPVLPSPMNFEILPNPNSGNFYVQIPISGQAVAKISVTDNLGQLIYMSDDLPSDRSYWHEIDLSHVQDGVYHVELVIGEEKFVKKIIIAKQ